MPLVKATYRFRSPERLLSLLGIADNVLPRPSWRHCRLLHSRWNSTTPCICRPGLDADKDFRRGANTMVVNSNDQQWIVPAGVRSPPGVRSRSLYPSLNMSQFHPLSSSCRRPCSQEPSQEKDVYCENVEELEGDMAELFDRFEKQLWMPVPVSGQSLEPQDSLGAEAPEQDPEQVLEQDKGLQDLSQDKALPPLTSLDYTISEDRFYAARKCKPQTPGSFWSYDMYRRILADGTSQIPKVHYCKSKATMERVCNNYFLGEKVIGFDMEWSIYANRFSGPRKNVSLIQFATQSHIALFHTALFEGSDFVAPTFRRIMGDASVSKVGVNISGDCTRLKNVLDVETKGIFELSHLYKLVKYTKEGKWKKINRRVVSMATQVQEILGLPMFKGSDVRTSSWDYPLNSAQILYSASDAYAGLQLYYVLDEARQKLDPCPPLPLHAEEGQAIRVAKMIDDEVKVVPSEETAPRTIDRSTPKKSAESTVAERDVRIVAAETRVEQFRTAKGLRYSASILRSYFMWYDNDDLTPEVIAGLLRNPPLQTNTVVSYILGAVIDAKQPYEKRRLKNDILSRLAPEVRAMPRFKALVDDVKDVTQG